jgi:hypothetical protein
VIILINSLKEHKENLASTGGSEPVVAGAQSTRARFPNSPGSQAASSLIQTQHELVLIGLFFFFKAHKVDLLYLTKLCELGNSMRQSSGETTYYSRGSTRN